MLRRRGAGEGGEMEEEEGRKKQGDTVCVGGGGGVTGVILGIIPQGVLIPSSPHGCSTGFECFRDETVSVHPAGRGLILHGLREINCIFSR